MAQLHGNHLPAAGAAAQASFSGEKLCISGARDGSIDVAALRITAGGFDNDQLTASWREGDARYALILSDAREIDEFVSAAPRTLVPQLKAFRRAVSRQNATVGMVLGSVGVLVLAFVLLWWRYDEAVGWVAHQIPQETEQRIGQTGLAQFSDMYTLSKDGAYPKLVAELGEKLVPDKGFTYQWHVADSDEINAFALPGGIIVVHRGLIDAAESSEELAGVLAHEIQHVEQRHVVQSMIHSLGWASVLAVALGDVSAIAGVLLFEAGATRFSRELESRADQGAVTALHAAGIDPGGMIRFFEKLIEKQGDIDIVLLSSHPASRDRINAVERLIAALPAVDYASPGIDWAGVKSLQNARLGDAEKTTVAPTDSTE